MFTYRDVTLYVNLISLPDSSEEPLPAHTFFREEVRAATEHRAPPPLGENQTSTSVPPRGLAAERNPAHLQIKISVGAAEWGPSAVDPAPEGSGGRIVM